MTTPAENASVASSTFGNDEQITSVSFTPEAPSNPTQPDLISEGKLLDGQALIANAVQMSRSVKITGKPGQSTIKTLYVQSDQAGTFVIQVLLDESEVSGGNSVWRNYTDPAAPIAVVAGKLYYLDFYSLFREMRIVFTNGAAPATVDAWVFSIP